MAGFDNCTTKEPTIWSGYCPSQISIQITEKYSQMSYNEVISLIAAFKPCYLVYFGKNREIQPSNVLQRGGYFARHLHSTLRGIGPGAFRKGQFISQRGRENVRMWGRPRECEIGRSKCVHCGTVSNTSWDCLWDWFWDCIWDCVRNWL